MNVKGLGQYAKFLTAIAGQALVYAQVTYGADNRWVQLATAAAAALAVFAVPNASKAPADVTMLPASKAPVMQATGTPAPPPGPPA